MHPTTFAAFFNRPPAGFPKADRPQQPDLIRAWKQLHHRRQDKQIADMTELLDEVIRTFQL